MTDHKDGDTWLEEFELHGKGIVRTEERCSECKKTIVAKINFEINGNHRIVCPYCGHIHFRVIKDGKMTGDRWSYKDIPEDAERWVEAPTESMWSDETLEIKTTAVHQHIREKFLGKVNGTG